MLSAGLVMLCTPTLSLCSPELSGCSLHYGHIKTPEGTIQLIPLLPTYINTKDASRYFYVPFISVETFVQRSGVITLKRFCLVYAGHSGYGAAIVAKTPSPTHTVDGGAERKKDRLGSCEDEGNHRLQ